eukprot:TRINITY_DN11349_c1_g1_i1.p1 TRINITY_DN11349_c1_g1~~TRINITY_DN11349_c1_g1_i1.p1  ORF type:complete len:540 (+),score=122.95 TRINITY_DN11349_c1_g1_i1:151-1770(+)
MALHKEIHCGTCGRDDAHFVYPEASFVRVTSHQPSQADGLGILGSPSLEVLRPPPVLPSLNTPAVKILASVERINHSLRSYQMDLGQTLRANGYAAPASSLLRFTPAVAASSSDQLDAGTRLADVQALCVELLACSLRAVVKSLEAATDRLKQQCQQLETDKAQLALALRKMQDKLKNTEEQLRAAQATPVDSLYAWPRADIEGKQHNAMLKLQRDYKHLQARHDTALVELQARAQAEARQAARYEKLETEHLQLQQEYDDLRRQLSTARKQSWASMDNENEQLPIPVTRTTSPQMPRLNNLELTGTQISRPSTSDPPASAMDAWSDSNAAPSASRPSSRPSSRAKTADYQRLSAMAEIHSSEIPDLLLCVLFQMRLVIRRAEEASLDAQDIFKLHSTKLSRVLRQIEVWREAKLSSWRVKLDKLLDLRAQLRLYSASSRPEVIVRTRLPPPQPAAETRDNHTVFHWDPYAVDVKQWYPDQAFDLPQARLHQSPTPVSLALQASRAGSPTASSRLNRIASLGEEPLDAIKLPPLPSMPS